MTLFQRTIRAMFGLVGLAVGLISAVAAIFARRMIAPARQPLWATPAQVGMDYEEISFPARDGVRLSGWFIPAAADAEQAGTIVLLHGWGWNRLGFAADDMLANLTGTGNVDFLGLIQTLAKAGYNVLTFDQRNHGESAPAGPVTFGQQEAQDLLGAVAYLEGRSDVDMARLGVLGFSMGANTMLYSLPQTTQIKAGIAVQGIFMLIAIVTDGIGSGLLFTLLVLCILGKLRQVVLGIVKSGLTVHPATVGADHRWPQKSYYIRTRIVKQGIRAQTE